MGAHIPSHPIIKKIISTFLNLEFSAFYPILVFKCYYDAFLAKYGLTGASNARVMVKVAPGVKTLPRA